MRKLFLTILIICCCVLTVRSQTTPAGSIPAGMPATVVTLPNTAKTQTDYERKAKMRKDSVLSLLNKYVQPGSGHSVKDSIRRGRKDTLPTKGRNTGLAPVSDMPETTKFIHSLDKGACKGLVFVPFDNGMGNQTIPPPPPAPARPPLAPAVPFLQIHGNVLYNLNYYSRIDTPYNERDIYQHTIQTWLDVLVKGQYPFRIYLTNHFSNSSLFKNFSDFNLGYNNAGFSQTVKDQVRKDYLRSLPSPKMLDSLRMLLGSALQKLQGLDGFINNPGLVQKLIEARELAELKKRMGKDSTSLGADSTEDESGIRHTDSLLAARKKEADSLRQRIADLQQLVQTAGVRSQAQIDRSCRNIQQAATPAELGKEMQELGIADTSLPKGYKTLMAIKSLNIGRTVVNYSELSVKNISVNGIQAEYNPSAYYAVAYGSVDYRFRDFIVQGPGQSKQYLTALRAGKTLKGGNSLILTYFTGKRQLYNASTVDSPAVQTPSSSLMGLTLEGNYHVTENILLTGEIGKSSRPGYSDSSHKSNPGSELLRLSDRSNEAWSLKANAFFPKTHTRIKAAYKHLAVNYQSFSIFTDGSAQSAWSANIDQLFFHKQLDLQLGANTNDFSNPFLNQQYRSTTVFKSIQATLRKRNWPVISLGYFPSSQVTKFGNSQYVENYFYTLVGNVTHSYHWHQLLMNTTLVYTQFYNRSADSGFVYFNTRNLMVNQTVFLNRFTLQLNASGATNQDYNLYTVEGKIQHNLSQALTLGAGIKYNKQTQYNIDQLGYSAEAILRITRLGQLQFSADKGFIPGMNKQLVPDNTGRLTYFKTF